MKWRCRLIDLTRNKVWDDAEFINWENEIELSINLY